MALSEGILTMLSTSGSCGSRVRCISVVGYGVDVIGCSSWVRIFLVGVVRGSCMLTVAVTSSYWRRSVLFCMEDRKWISESDLAEPLVALSVGVAVLFLMVSSLCWSTSMLSTLL